MIFALFRSSYPRYRQFTHLSPFFSGNRGAKIRKSLEIFREGTADYTDFTDKDSRSVAKTTPLR